MLCDKSIAKPRKLFFVKFKKIKIASFTRYIFISDRFVENLGKMQGHNISLTSCDPHKYRDLIEETL